MQRHLHAVVGQVRVRVRVRVRVGVGVGVGVRVGARVRARVRVRAGANLYAVVGQVDAASIIGNHGVVAGDPHVTQLVRVRARARVKHTEPSFMWLNLHVAARG